MGCADTGGCQSGCVPPGAYEKMYEMDSDFRHHHDTGGALHDKRFLAQLVMVGLSAGSRTGTHCLCSGERNEEALTGEAVIEEAVIEEAAVEEAAVG